MALKGYADLFTNVRFSWDPRSELYQINGVVFNIDYLDERAFAEAAAARAKAVEIVGICLSRQVYRKSRRAVAGLSGHEHRPRLGRV